MRYCPLFYVLLMSLSLSCYAVLPPVVDNTPLPSLAPMLEKTTPAVVNISTLTYIRTQDHPLLSDPFFRHFFDLPPQQSPRQRKRENSLGSGVIVDARRGHVLTNHHVIDKADEIKVTLQDGRKLDAKLIGSDPDTDIALLQIPAENLTAVQLANTNHLRVGDFVVAIGNPFGLGQSVTSGIISALGRSGLGIEGYEDFIQTDASINRGNSGGALVNLRGELVGINTAILAPSGGNIGIGFAIPSNLAAQIMEHLLVYGEVRRGSLGISVHNLTPELQTAFNMSPTQGGAVIAAIEPNSPAAKSGLQVGDVIVAINGKSVNSTSELGNRIGLLREGDVARVKVLRDGRAFEHQATISNVGISGHKISPILKGTTLRNKNDGVAITNVQHRSVAEQIGLETGDVIVGVNRHSVDNLDELSAYLAHRLPPLSLQVRRDGRLVSLVVR